MDHDFLTLDEYFDGIDDELLSSELYIGMRLYHWYCDTEFTLTRRLKNESWGVKYIDSRGKTRSQALKEHEILKCSPLEFSKSR